MDREDEDGDRSDAPGPRRAGDDEPPGAGDHDAESAPAIDRRALAAELRDRFDGDPEECRAVARAAADLAAAGRLERDRGTPADADAVVAALADAPGGGPGARWNWWVGSLDVAYGGYADLALRGYPVAGRGDPDPEA